MSYRRQPALRVEDRLRLKAQFDMHCDFDNVKIMCSLKGDEVEVRGD